MSKIVASEGGFEITVYCGPVDTIGGDRSYAQITTPNNRFVQMPLAVLESLVDQVRLMKRTVAGSAQHQQR